MPMYNPPGALPHTYAGCNIAGNLGNGHETDDGVYHPNYKANSGVVCRRQQHFCQPGQPFGTPAWRQQQKTVCLHMEASDMSM